MKHRTPLAFRLLGATLLAAATSACAPVSGTAARPNWDPEVAKAIAHGEHCLACHSLTKQKTGPSYKAVAMKYDGNPNAEAELYEHLTTGDAAKMSGGYIEFHKSIAKQRPEEIRDLVRWILDQSSDR